MTQAKRALRALALVAWPAVVGAAVAQVSGPSGARADAQASGPASAPQGADAATAQPMAVTPEADRALRQMTDYLGNLQRFKVQASSIDEIVTKTGRKIQIATESLISVERPNKLRSDQIGSENALEYWYDGKTSTLYCKANNTYATAKAPATIDEAIDATRKQYKIEAPGADLLFSHPYDILTEQVKTGLVIGRETVSGSAATHLAFEGDDVDWQIWIQEGDQPLPLRFVITTKTMKEQPQFTVQLSNWDTQAKFGDADFMFEPPNGSTQVESFPTTCRANR